MDRVRTDQSNNATEVRRAQPKKVRVFISHARADSQIAGALHDEIIDMGRGQVSCFLDTQTIESGEGWESKLERELKAADWLVCIYTGEQSEFCGYEIGVFTGGRALQKVRGDSRLVCLHNVPDYPAVFRLHQNRFIEFPPERPSSGQTFDETSFYEHSQVAKFFFDFCNYDDLWVPREQEEIRRKTETIIRKAKLVTEAFRAARGNDVRADTPTQLGIEVSVPYNIGESLASIPLDAQVKGTYQSYNLFGLMPPMQGEQLPVSTWGAIKAARPYPFSGYLPWIDQLEKDMLNAANGLALSQPEATFRSDDNKTYRAILIRHVLHWDGRHRFFIVFVETLPRQFVGDENTSLILAGLVVASRLRFHYLEKPERIEARFDDKLPTTSSRQIIDSSFTTLSVFAKKRWNSVCSITQRSSSHLDGRARPRPSHSSKRRRRHDRRSKPTCLQRPPRLAAKTGRASRVPS